MRHNRARRLVPFTALIVTLAFSAASSGFAQTRPAKYAIEMVVTREGKSVETDADITFTETGVTIVPDKQSFSGERREWPYSSIKTVDYSYSKKPMISVGGAVVAALLISVLLPVPFLFLKKKKYWMTVNTESGYAVLKLGDRNHRQIAGEFRAYGVTVGDLIREGK